MRILLVLLLAASCQAETIHGRVERVVDGDTVVLVIDAEKIKIRLEGIDAPEMDQPFGREAKAALQMAVDGRAVYVCVKERDKYGRLVGVILADATDINARMVMLGFAWHCKFFNKSPLLAKLEAKARSQKRGLWEKGEPVAPWDWRYKQKKKRKLK